MSRVRLALAGLMLIGAFAVTGGAGAPAAIAAPSVTAGQQDMTQVVFGEPLGELLSRFPDATRQPDGSYQLEPGVRLVPPMESSDIGIAEYPSGCDDQWFCLWEHSDFAGWSAWFYECRQVWLNGFANLASSMHNAQNSYRAYFWDTDPSPDIYASLAPNSYWRNMRYNRAPDGGNWNDRIDEVDPC